MHIAAHNSTLVNNLNPARIQNSTNAPAPTHEFTTNAVIEHNTHPSDNPESRTRWSRFFDAGCALLDSVNACISHCIPASSANSATDNTPVVHDERTPLLPTTPMNSGINGIQHIDVEENTTLADLNRLHATCHAAPARNVLLGRETESGIALYFDVESAADNDKQELGRAGVKKILRNTLEKFDVELSGTHAEELLNHALEQANSGSKISKEEIGALLGNLGPHLHVEVTKKIGPSLAPRDTPRMPVDRMMNLISALEDAKGHPAISDDQKALIEIVQQEAKSMYLGHQLSPEILVKFFSTLQDNFKTLKLNELARLTAELSKNMPMLRDVSKFSALHENMSGRVLETHIAHALIEHPSQRILNATRALSSYLQSIVDSMPRSKIAAAVASLTNVLQAQKQRGYFRMGVSEALNNILSEKDAGKAEAHLRDFLSAPPSTGRECIEIILVALSMAYAFDEHPDIMQWRDEREKFYAEVIKPEKASIRMENAASFTRTAGLTLHYQPPTIPKNSANQPLRPIDRFNPDIHEPSETLVSTLRSGESYATGPSGHVVRLLYLAHYARHLEGGDGIDVTPLIAVHASCLIHAGAHTLNELLKTANHFDKHVDAHLQLSERRSNPNTYISDYQRFLSEVYRDDDPKMQENIENQIWKNTILHYREHSYYGAVNRDNASASGHKHVNSQSSNSLGLAGIASVSAISISD